MEKRQRIDYEQIYQLLKKKNIFTFSDVKEIAGCEGKGANASTLQIINTLSLRYPIYELERGVYKVYGDDDYGTGINYEALRKYEEENKC